MATSIAATEERTVSIGTILGRAFGVMGDNPLAIFGLAFLFGSLPQLIFSYFSQTLAADPVRYFVATIVMSIGSVIVFFALGMLVQGALVRATTAFSRGERASIGECLAVGISAVVPLIGLSLLAAIGLILGFAILIVPGFVLLAMWAVVAPVLVEEKTGILEAFGRSLSLTKGVRWKVFGLQLILFMIIWLVSAVLGVLMITMIAPETFAQGAFPIAFYAVSAVANTFTTALWSTGQASLYVSLRSWKEGPQTDILADVFA